jgi:hypothetical protein
MEDSVVGGIPIASMGSGRKEENLIIVMAIIT